MKIIILTLLAIILIFNHGISAQQYQQSQIDSLITKSKNLSGEAGIDMLLKISDAYLDSDSNKCYQYASLALTKSQSINYTLGIAKSYFELGLLANLSSSTESFLHNSSEAYKYAIKTTDTSTIAAAANLLGKANFQVNYNEASKYFKIAAEKYSELKDTSQYLKALNNIGTANIEASNLDTAAVYLTKALKIAERINDEKRIAKLLGDLGVVYQQLDENNIALEYLKKAYIKSKKLGNKSYIATTSLNIGVNYLNRKEYHDAYPYFSESLTIYKELNDQISVADVYMNLGQLFFEQNQYQDALNNDIKAFKIYKESEITYSIGNAAGAIAKAYTKLGNYKMANEYYKMAEGIAVKVNNLKLFRDVYFDISRFNSVTGDSKNELIYFKKYIIYRDSITNQDKENQITGLRTKYETEKKEQQIILLKKDEVIQSAALNNETLLRNSFIGAFVFAIILAIGLYNRYRFKNKANKELSLAREKADEANRLKSELLSIAAHDLKNPLNSIVGFTRLLGKKVPANSTEKEFISTIEESSGNMLMLINQLLNSSAIETGKIEVNISPVDFKQVANEIVKEYSNIAQLKKQTITSKIPDNQLIVSADSERLKEVIANLVSNAIKYSDYGKDIKINLREENGNAVFEVIDKGPGLTEEDKKKIFGKFQKLSAKPTGGENSTGLGLSIAKQLIEMQGGSISVESNFNKGSKFIITMPVVNSEKGELIENIKVSGPKELGGIVFEPATIIIADDISENRRLIKEIISEYDFTIFEVNNGRELVDLTTVVKPDLIFSDIKMPEMDGFEALKNIRQNIALSNIPVVAVTAEDKQKVLDFGFYECLNKPIESSEILLVLKTALKIKKDFNEIIKPVQKELGNFAGSTIKKALLIEKLNTDYLQQCQRLKSTLIIDEIQSFAESLENISRVHNSEQLNIFAADLLRDCNSFNITGLKKSLNNFNKLISQIEIMD